MTTSSHLKIQMIIIQNNDNIMENILTFRTVLSCPSVAIFTFTFTTSSSRPLLPMTVVRRVIKNWRAGKSLHLTSVSHNQK